MNCSGCGSEIPLNFVVCPRCGKKIQPANAVVQLDFSGTAMQLLGWMLLTGVATLVVVPLAWAQGGKPVALQKPAVQRRNYGYLSRYRRTSGWLDDPLSRV